MKKWQAFKLLSISTTSAAFVLCPIVSSFTVDRSDTNNLDSSNVANISDDAFHLPTLADQSTVMDMFNMIRNDTAVNPFLKNNNQSYQTAYDAIMHNNSDALIKSFWSLPGTTTPWNSNILFQLKSFGWDPRGHLFYTAGFNTELLFYLSNLWFNSTKNSVFFPKNPDGSPGWQGMEQWFDGDDYSQADFGMKAGNNTIQLNLNHNYFFKNYCGFTSDTVVGGRYTWVNNDILKMDKNEYDGQMATLHNVLLDQMSSPHQVLSADNYYLLKKSFQDYVKGVKAIPTPHVIHTWLKDTSKSDYGWTADDAPAKHNGFDYRWDVSNNGWNTLGTKLISSSGSMKYQDLPADLFGYVLAELAQIHYSQWSTFYMVYDNPETNHWYKTANWSQTNGFVGSPSLGDGDDWKNGNQNSADWSKDGNNGEFKDQAFAGVRDNLQGVSFYDYQDISDSKWKVYFPWSLSQRIIQNTDEKLNFIFNVVVINSTQDTVLANLESSGIDNANPNVYVNNLCNFDPKTNLFGLSNLDIADFPVGARGNTTMHAYTYTIAADQKTLKLVSDFYNGTPITTAICKDDKGNPLTADNAIGKVCDPKDIDKDKLLEEDGSLFYVIKNLFNMTINPNSNKSPIDSTTTTNLQTITSGYFPFAFFDAIKNRDTPDNLQVLPPIYPSVYQDDPSANQPHANQWDWLTPSTTPGHTYDLFYLWMCNININNDSLTSGTSGYQVNDILTGTVHGIDWSISVDSVDAGGKITSWHQNNGIDRIDDYISTPETTTLANGHGTGAILSITSTPSFIDPNHAGQDATHPLWRFKYSPLIIDNQKGTIGLNINAYAFNTTNNTWEVVLGDDGKTPFVYNSWVSPDGSFAIFNAPEPTGSRTWMIVLGSILGGLVIGGLITWIVLLRKGKTKTNWRIKRQRKIEGADDED